MLQRLLHNHVLANLAFALVLVLGVLSYLIMPREQDPEINFNWIDITTILPGASALDVEARVTDVLEEAIEKVADVKFVNSVSGAGVSSILVRFEEIDERTFDKRVNDLRREIQAVRAELPDETVDSVITEITTDNAFPSVILAVTGPAEDENLRRQARVVKQDLERIDGVSSVLASGLRDPELQVEFDPRALSSRQVSPTALADTVAAHYRDLAAGSVQVGSESWLVRLRGNSADPQHLGNLPVLGAGGELRLDELATVARGRSRAERLVRTGGQPAVLLSVTKTAGTNTLALVERINDYRASRNRLQRETGVDLVLVDDQTELTRNALRIMQNNALLGLGLVLLVTWLFLGNRISLITCIGIPFILAATFWFLSSIGQTLNVTVLLGVVISLGMLVDDAVVVAEAVYYRLQRGAEVVAATLGALREVVAPVTTAVLTTIAAFLPLMLLPGILGKFMLIIPLVVTTALCVSLVEAYWMLPVHVVAAGVSRRRRGASGGGWLFRTARLLAGLPLLPLRLALRGLDALDARVAPRRKRALRRVRTRYTRVMVAVLRRPRLTLSGIGLLLLLTVGMLVVDTLPAELPRDLPQRLQEYGLERERAAALARLGEALYPTRAIAFLARHTLKFDFFASDPIRLFYVNLQMPVGTPLEESMRALQSLEARVRERIETAELRSIVAYTGIMFTETAPFFGDRFGQLAISLRPKTPLLRTVDEVIGAVRPALEGVPGPESLSILRIAGGPPTTRPVSVKVRGSDFAQLRAAAADLKRALAEQPALLDVTDDAAAGQRTLSARLNVEAARRAGVDPRDVARTLRLLVDGEVVASMREAGETLEVRVRAAPRALHDIDQLLDIRLPGAAGGVPLAGLLELDYARTPEAIRHHNFRRTITVEADIDRTRIDALAAGRLVASLWDELQPRYPTLSIDQSGLLDDIQESLDAIGLLFLLGLGLMYLILGTQFGSYFQPLMILVAVPLAGTGVVWGLLLSGDPMSLFTLYGVVALAGIAVNSAIVLISAANARLAAGMSVLHATLYAGRRRVVPILITSLTTVAGLFSLATGLGGHSLLWGPVAAAIVWGLMFSTVLTLLVVPLLYRLFMRNSRLARARPVVAPLGA